MTRAMTARVAFTALMALATAGPALAQSHRLNAAWEAAINEEGGYLAPAAQARLNLVAYHAAVAKLCEGFPVDEAKVAEASNAAIVEALAGLEGDALIARHADILIDIGTRHGLFLAEGSLHPEKFCDQAAEVRADAEFEDFWR